MKVQMKPVCSNCGHIFTELDIITHTTLVSSHSNGIELFSAYNMNPAACPGCGEKIDSVELYVGSDKEFKYNEQIYRKD